jgi:hypothetical protein
MRKHLAIASLILLTATFSVSFTNPLKKQPPTVTINGAAYYAWTHSGSGGGTINAPAGTTVGLAIAAFGPGNSVTFTLSGATLSGGSNTVVVNNNDVPRTFIMPASGSVSWSATYVTPAGGGNGNIAPYIP